MAIVDSQSGKVVATAPIGEGADAVAYDEGSGLVFSSNGESGNLTILHQDSADHYTVRQTLSTMLGARTLALDPTSHRVYTVSAKLGPKPAVTKETPKPKPQVVPDSFVVLVIAQ
jgi:hypothetical protein